MISVVLCTFNGERFLSEQLSSFTAQTILPDELVVCDDGSTDGTIKILREFKEAATFKVSIYENDYSLGVVKNFEKAIGLCDGDIIFLSDQDDIWKKNKVEKIIACFNGDPNLQAVFSNGDLINEEGDIQGKKLWDIFDFTPEIQKKWKNGQAFYDLLYNRNKVTGATMAIRKTLFEAARPFQVMDDAWHDLWISAHAAAMNGLSWVSESLIFYRVHKYQQVGIGEGVAKQESRSKAGLQPSLKDIFNYQQSLYERCLGLAEIFLARYPQLDRGKALQEGRNAYAYLRLRQGLPANILSRVVRIARNYPLYRQFTPSVLRSMIRDVFKPVR